MGGQDVFRRVMSTPRCKWPICPQTWMVH